MKVTTILAVFLACIAITQAQAQVPPANTPLFLVFGYSGMNGHCKFSDVPQPANGQHIWRWMNGAWTQNPQEPLWEVGRPEGCSPARYFADEYIASGNASDVAIAMCYPGGSEGNWHDGVMGWPQAVIDACATQWKAAQANGAGPLKGAFIYCCEGDYQTQTEVDNFRVRFAALANRLRTTASNVDLPIIMTVVADCTDKGAEYTSLTDKLQSQMRGATAGRLGVISAEGLPFLAPRKCFHLNHVGQKEVGRRAGALMP